jgi:serine/threonine protein kinase
VTSERGASSDAFPSVQNWRIMSQTTDPRVGSTVGGYRIESLIGRGGMSVVYLAEHIRLVRITWVEALPAAVFLAGPPAGSETV